MSFKKFIEIQLPHVNNIGFQFADKLKLIRGGTTAMNQDDSNCYEVASTLAKHFGYEPAPYEEVDRIKNKFGEYYFARTYNKNAKPPVLPRPGIANFIVRQGDQLMAHVSFEYRGREYNYSDGLKQGFKILFRLPLKKATAQNHTPA